ncbi:MAG: hypothetical protein KF858_11600 [Candidatus Sumerlaeia bacterium]|nr:hypothetical protein [Candidatus Sumerlaeia bacterium]
MPIQIDGNTLLAYAERAMQAIEMVPEERRDSLVWQGTFRLADGTTKEEKAQTPAELAADIVAALPIMASMAKGESDFDAAVHDALHAEQTRVAQLPMREIAALGRRYAAEAAQVIDALGAIPADATLKTPRGEMPRQVAAVLLFTHVVHHRGQLYQMLRTLGLRPPGFL